MTIRVLRVIEYKFQDYMTYEKHMANTKDKLFVKPGMVMRSIAFSPELLESPEIDKELGTCPTCKSRLPWQHPRETTCKDEWHNV